MGLQDEVAALCGSGFQLVKGGGGVPQLHGNGTTTYSRPGLLNFNGEKSLVDILSIMPCASQAGQHKHSRATTYLTLIRGTSMRLADIVLINPGADHHHVYTPHLHQSIDRMHEGFNEPQGPSCGVAIRTVCGIWADVTP